MADAFENMFDVASPALLASDAMRGTNSAALAATALSNSVWTNAKAAFLDIAVSSRSSHTAAAVWAVGERTLTSFGTLATDTAAAVWAYVVEGSRSALYFMRVMYAVIRGKLRGGGTNTLEFLGDDGVNVRHTATVDVDGNRTAVSSDGS
jgi:hypothetical protein